MDSHEIWHASTENWNRLGDERGFLHQTTTVDDSKTSETDESSNHSDSVIELSSDEEEEESKEESDDDSSDIEIIEEIAFNPIQDNKAAEAPAETQKSCSEVTDASDAKVSDGQGAENVNGTFKPQETETGDAKLVDEDGIEENANGIKEKTEGTNASKVNQEEAGAEVKAGE